MKYGFVYTLLAIGLIAALIFSAPAKKSESHPIRPGETIFIPVK